LDKKGEISRRFSTHSGKAWRGLKPANLMKTFKWGLQGFFIILILIILIIVIIISTKTIHGIKALESVYK